MTASPKLRFLADTAIAEAELLQTTDGRLFAVAMTAERAASLRTDIDLAERTDAFVARFGRLQDSVADKLLPALLDGLAEPVGPAIDNLNKAERLGWIGSVDAWIEVRRLRNRMIHKYVRDPAELASALRAAHAAVPLLADAAAAMVARGWLIRKGAKAVDGPETAKPAGAHLSARPAAQPQAPGARRHL